MNRKTLIIYETHHSYELVWSIIKDVRLTNHFCNFIEKNMASEPVFIKGRSSSEISAEFHCKWKNKFELFFRVEELIETGYYCRLKWKAYKTEPETSPYFFIYNLHKISDEYCLITVEMQYFSNVMMLKQDAEKLHSERWKILLAIDNCISSKEHLKYQTEMERITGSIEMIWTILTNFKILRQLVPFICDKVDYEGDYLRPGMRMTFTWNNENQEMNVLLSVLEVSTSNDGGIIKYESLGINPLVPKQTVEWRVNKVSEEDCVVTIIHKFDVPMSPITLDAISLLKIKILKRLKASFGKYTNRINKKEDVNER